MACDPLDPSVTEALRAWSVQHGAGVAPAKALATCAELCGRRARPCFEEAARLAAAGTADAELLQALAPALPAADRAVVGAGVRGGRLDAALDSVVTRRSLLHATRKRIRSRLILPAAVFVAAVFVAPLPALVLGGSGWAYLFDVAVPLALVAAAWRVLARAARARVAPAGEEDSAMAPTAAATLDRMALACPVLGRLERHRNLSEFSALLGRLLGAGVVLSEALETCARVLPNGVYRQEVLRCARQVQGGQTLSSLLTDRALWPPEFAVSVAVAEQAGALEETCARLARHWNESYVELVEELAAWLPRLIYALVCLYVMYQIVTLVTRLADIYGSV